MDRLTAQGTGGASASNPKPELQEQTAWNPWQHLPDQSTLHFPGSPLDTSGFANSLDFHPANYAALDHEHLDRIPSGGSVIDTSAVYDDSGRSFHSYKEGKYYLPNDPVLMLPLHLGIIR
jgi:hypothetical protein